MDLKELPYLFEYEKGKYINLKHIISIEQCAYDPSIFQYLFIGPHVVNIPEEAHRVLIQYLTDNNVF